MPDREEEKARLRRQLEKEAISLAMQSRWEEAVAVNRSIIESFPTDVDAYNRLGRALMELGEFAQAKEAYARALELAPHNVIAKKNLERLSLLQETAKAVKKDYHKVVPQVFVAEMGKAGVVKLLNLAPKEILAKMAAGEEVYLKVRGQHLIVENSSGEYLGEVEPKHGLRLIKLIEGGNKYIAAIVSLEDEVKVIIRETFQHPSQAGRLSFPVKPVEGFRPYIKDTLLRRSAISEAEEFWEEVEYGQEEEAALIPEGFSILEEASSAEEIEETEEE